MTDRSATPRTDGLPREVSEPTVRKRHASCGQYSPERAAASSPRNHMSGGPLLQPEFVEAVAQRVVQLLRCEQPTPEWIDATEAARGLGVSRSYVYEHSADLGAVRLGGGSKPRLRFDASRLTALPGSERSVADPPMEA